MKVLCSTQMAHDTTVLGQTMRGVAVAKALQRAGHDVTFLVSAKLASVVSSHGLRVLDAPAPDPALAPGLLSALMSDEARAEALARMVASIPRQVEVDARAIASVRPDVVVSGNLSANLAARSARLPSALVFLQPHGERTIHALVQHLALSREAEALVADLADATDLLLVEGMPELGARVPIPFDWAARAAAKVRYVGPLLPSPPEELPPRQELRRAYIGEGDEPLVYVTIGGGSPLIGESFLHVVLEMFRQAPELRGLVATGLEVVPEKLRDVPRNVILRGFVPGTELCKASDVTVFHGGSSTTMTCIACGTPAVVVPSMAEQEDNAAVFADHGAGIVLEKASFTAATLLEAVRTILRDGRFRASAERLQELGRRYGGAAGAAALVESLYRPSTGGP